MQMKYICLKSCIRHQTYDCYLLILQEMHQGTQNYENVPELYATVISRDREYT